MRKFLKVSLIIIRSILIFLLIGAVLTASVQNVQKMIRVEQFKAKGEYQENLSTSTVKYYKIESDETLIAYTRQGNDILPGAPADILISTQATLVNPLVSGLVSYFAGGHAAICMDTYRDFENSITVNNTIEATGLGEGEMVSETFHKGYWSKDDPFTEVMAFRANLTESQRKEVISVSASMLDEPYNYSFLFNTKNTSYCSDLVSKVYQHVGINLNKDSFTTSIYDIVVSKDVYLSYYHYYDSDGVKHVYYLG